VRPLETVAFLDKNTLVMGASTLRAQYDPQKQWSNWPSVNFTAVDSALYFCIRRYNSRVINGRLVENSTEVASTRSPEFQ
jgi:hypothetical protein